MEEAPVYTVVMKDDIKQDDNVEFLLSMAQSMPFSKWMVHAKGHTHKQLKQVRKRASSRGGDALYLEPKTKSSMFVDRRAVAFAPSRPRPVRKSPASPPSPQKSPASPSSPKTRISPKKSPASPLSPKTRLSPNKSPASPLSPQTRASPLATRKVPAERKLSRKASSNTVSVASADPISDERPPVRQDSTNLHKKRLAAASAASASAPAPAPVPAPAPSSPSSHRESIRQRKQELKKKLEIIKAEEEAAAKRVAERRSSASSVRFSQQKSPPGKAWSGVSQEDLILSPEYEDDDGEDAEGPKRLDSFQVHKRRMSASMSHGSHQSPSVEQRSINTARSTAEDIRSATAPSLHSSGHPEYQPSSSYASLSSYSRPAYVKAASLESSVSSSSHRVSQIESAVASGAGMLAAAAGEVIANRGRGWLVKRGGIVRNWKRRWFHWHTGRLYYYEKQYYPPLPPPFAPPNQKLQKEKGSIDIRNAEINLVPQSTYKRDHCFSLTPVHGSRTFILQADTVEERNGWLEFLIRNGAHGDGLEFFISSTNGRTPSQSVTMEELSFRGLIMALRRSGSLTKDQYKEAQGLDDAIKDRVYAVCKSSGQRKACISLKPFLKSPDPDPDAIEPSRRFSVSLSGNQGYAISPLLYKATSMQAMGPRGAEAVAGAAATIAGKGAPPDTARGRVGGKNSVFAWSLDVKPGLSRARSAGKRSSRRGSTQPVSLTEPQRSRRNLRRGSAVPLGASHGRIPTSYEEPLRDAGLQRVATTLTMQFAKLYSQQHGHTPRFQLYVKWLDENDVERNSRVPEEVYNGLTLPLQVLQRRALLQQRSRTPSESAAEDARKMADRAAAPMKYHRRTATVATSTPATVPARSGGSGPRFVSTGPSRSNLLSGVNETEETKQTETKRKVEVSFSETELRPRRAGARSRVPKLTTNSQVSDKEAEDILLSAMKVAQTTPENLSRSSTFMRERGPARAESDSDDDDAEPEVSFEINVSAD